MNHAEDFFTDGSVFMFLEGTHVLNQVLLIDNVNNITVMGQGRSEIGFHDNIVQTTVKLQCAANSSAGLMFVNVTGLSLTGTLLLLIVTFLHLG